MGNGKGVSIKGDVTGLAKDKTDYGIHIHAGTDCTDADKVGGHDLYKGDGWQTGKNSWYVTDANGESTINVAAPKNAYSLNGTDANVPKVEGHCIVMHGGETETGERVAIGKITCDDQGVCTATMGPYPGYSNTDIIPSGTVTVTESGGIVSLRGTVSGLKKSATDEKTYGIHVHTGTDCTGGPDNTKYNEVIGGHLFSSSVDGWVWPAPTTYTTNVEGKATIDVFAESYSLTGTDDTQPGVKDHCIVLHGTSDDGSPRVGIAKIIEDPITPKPTPAPGSDPGTNGAYIGMGGFLPLFFAFTA